METMKNEKPKPARHKLVAELAEMEGIPVYELTFATNKPDIDGTGGTGKLRMKPDPRALVKDQHAGREIAFLPKLNRYRVVEKSHDPKIGTHTYYIPGDWATFEPLE